MGTGLWAESELLLDEAVVYMLSAQGGGDVQGVLDHKCFFEFPLCKTTFAKFLWYLSFSSIIARGEIYRQS